MGICRTEERKLERIEKGFFFLGKGMYLYKEYWKVEKFGKKLKKRKERNCNKSNFFSFLENCWKIERDCRNLERNNGKEGKEIGKSWNEINERKGKK